MVTNGRMFLDIIGLYFKALFRDEKSTLACVLLTLQASVGSCVRVGGI